MKFDLRLTNTGDLTFTSSNSKFNRDKFEFNFHVAPTNSLLFNFEVSNTDTSNSIKRPARATKVSYVVGTRDSIDLIENPKVGERVYIEDEQKTYRIGIVNELIYIDEETMEEIKVNKIGYLDPVEYSETIFQYDFYAYTLQHDKVNKIIGGKDYMQQAIKLRLNTEINSIRGNEDMGADLFKFMHSNTQQSKLLNNISNQVKEAISDILPNCTVQAYIINSDYLNYHDSIKIVIINNEEIYYFYI